MTIYTSDWKVATCWSRFVKGTKYRHIEYDCVICTQYIEVTDGVKHYEFYNKATNTKIDVFSSAQMQAVEKILYFIEHEDNFKTVEEES